MENKCLEDVFSKHINIIIKNIINETKNIINENYLNDRFNSWLVHGADWDFKYVYEIKFKEYFLEYFTIESEMFLSYYSQNLCCMVEAYYESFQKIDYITFYLIEKFIINQFKNIDEKQLYLNI